MPAKTWTTVTDFTDFDVTEETLLSLTSDPNAKSVVDEGGGDGSITVADGYALAIYRTPVYESASWQLHTAAEFVIDGADFPTGSTALIRFRSDDVTFAEDAVTPAWSDWFAAEAIHYDETNDETTFALNLLEFFVNNPAESVGAFVQYELAMVRG